MCAARDDNDDLTPPPPLPAESSSGSEDQRPRKRKSLRRRRIRQPKPISDADVQPPPMPDEDSSQSDKDQSSWKYRQRKSLRRRRTRRSKQLANEDADVKAIVLREKSSQSDGGRRSSEAREWTSSRKYKATARNLAGHQEVVIPFKFGKRNGQLVLKYRARVVKRGRSTSVSVNDPEEKDVGGAGTQ